MDNNDLLSQIMDVGIRRNTGRTHQVINLADRTITVAITQRSDLETQLNGAVSELFAPAKQLRQGVLVTRLSPELFRVSLSENVPYGTTVENVSF